MRDIQGYDRRAYQLAREYWPSLGMDTMLNTLENFLHRAFVIPADAARLNAAVPPRPRRTPKEETVVIQGNIHRHRNMPGSGFNLQSREVFKLADVVYSPDFFDQFFRAKLRTLQ